MSGMPSALLYIGFGRFRQVKGHLESGQIAETERGQRKGSVIIPACEIFPLVRSLRTQITL